MTEPTTEAMKCIEEILAILEELYEISRTQQRLLTRGAKAQEPDDAQMTEPADFSVIMVKREQLLSRLQDKEASFQDMMKRLPELSENAEIQQGKAKLKDVLSRLIQSDHYVMEGLAFVQQRTAVGLLKNIKMREMLKSYHEAKKANDLITRIFGDNPRRIDARR